MGTRASLVRTAHCLACLVILLLSFSSSSFAQSAQEAKPETCCDAHDTHGLSWVSEKAQCQAVLLCVHGLGLCARAYDNLGKRISPEGIATYAVDVHGFGRPDEGRQAKLDLDGTVSDIYSILLELRKKYPGKPIFLLGESMGGAIAIRVAALHPDAVDGIVCSAPAWKLYKEKTTAFKGLLTIPFKRNPRISIVAAGVMKQATSKPELKQHWLADASHRLDLSIPEALQFARFIHRTPANAVMIKTIPVLFLQGLDDNLVKPGSAAWLFNKLGSREKKLVLMTNSEHLIFEEDQFSDSAVACLTAWMREHTAPASSTGARVGALVIGPVHGREIAIKKFFKLAHVNVALVDDSSQEPGGKQ